MSLDCPVFTADVSGLSSVYCWCLWIVQCLVLMSLDCPVLIASSVFVLYLVWVCPVFTADVSGLSSFDCFFCLRSVYCVSVSSVYCWCLSIVQFWLPLLSSSCILCECVQCLLLMSLDCPVLIASSVIVLYIVWVCPVFTADVSRLSSFDFFFCLRSVSCVSVSSVYCWCL
jgi:hypothetical protein